MTCEWCDGGDSGEGGMVHGGDSNVLGDMEVVGWWYGGTGGVLVGGGVHVIRVVVMEMTVVVGECMGVVEVVVLLSLPLSTFHNHTFPGTEQHRRLTLGGEGTQCIEECIEEGVMAGFAVDAGAGVRVEGGPSNAYEWVEKEHSQAAHQHPGGNHGSPHLEKIRQVTDYVNVDKTSIHISK